MFRVHEKDVIVIE